MRINYKGKAIICQRLPLNCDLSSGQSLYKINWLRTRFFAKIVVLY